MKPARVAAHPRGAGRATLGAVAAPLRWLSCALLLAAACGDDGSGYRVLVRFGDDALAERTERIEVALIGACDELARGAPPPSTARRLEVERGETPAAFGEVEAGTAGLYARGFDEDTCSVVAAGCATVELEEGGSGTLVVQIDAIPERGCPGGTQCVAGSCTSVGGVDAGPARDDGGSRDAGPAPDAGVVVDRDGWVDVPCPTGAGGFCGDALAGVYGQCYLTTSGTRCCAGCYDRRTQRCEPGDADSLCGWGGGACEACPVDAACVSFDQFRQCR